MKEGDDVQTEALKELLKTIEGNDTKNRARTNINEEGVLQCLFLQLEYQLEWLQLYGQLFHIDGTFKVNTENYLLYVIMVQNSNGEGRPVAYCWMKTENVENLEFLYSQILDLPDLPEVKVIIVDKDLTNLPVLKRYFPETIILLCTFHVIKWLKSVIAKIVISSQLKNEIMFRIKALVNAQSEEIYNENYKIFCDLCRENKLECENKAPLEEYFYDNWHLNQIELVYYYRKSMTTWGTNTNNHLESFNQNVKISVNHHLHLTDSINEIIKITKEYLDNQPLKNHTDWRKNTAYDCIKEASISEMFRKVDDKSGLWMLSEYKLIDLDPKINNYQYKHHGDTGYEKIKYEKIF